PSASDAQRQTICSSSPPDLKLPDRITNPHLKLRVAAYPADPFSGGFAKVSLYRVHPTEKSSDKDVPRRRPVIQKCGKGAVPYSRRARHSGGRSDEPSLHKKALARRHNRQS